MLSQGVAQRRRTGVPLSALLAAEPRPAPEPVEPPTPDHMLQESLRANGGTMTRQQYQGALSEIDSVHGKGRGKQAHAALVDAGVVHKNRARSTSYRMDI